MAGSTRPNRALIRPGVDREHGRRGGAGRDREPRLDHAVVPLALQEQHHAEQEDREPDEVQEQRDRRPGERPAGEQVPLDQRVRVPQRPPHRQRRSRPPRPPAARPSRPEPQPQAGPCTVPSTSSVTDASSEQRRHPVRQPAPGRRAHLGQYPSGPPSSVTIPIGTLMRKIHRQDDPDEQPADRRPGGGRDGGDPGPDADHHGVLPLAGTPGRAARARSARSAPRRPPAPPAPRPARPGVGAAAHAAEARVNTSDPDEQEPAAAEVVGQPPGRHQQRGEDDRVGVQHPRQPATATPRVGRPIVGSATLTMNRSSWAMKATAASTAMIHQRAGCPCRRTPRPTPPAAGRGARRRVSPSLS